MAKADGKVVISTALDNKGLEKGINNVSGKLGGLKSVVGKLGAAVAAAFAVQKIVQFGAESVQAARELSDAMTGLQSIMEGQGRSFSQAQKFIDEYVSDGLVPATNAITAYKNLALRGYDDSQIQQVMVALKDSAAFGRQASYSMGQAVESATEGLKNENSILVDNAGVTKNVAKMWDEYARSIGTTSNNLTQQQKIQAEVSGIMEESKYQTGDAAKVAGTFSGQLMQLSFNFNNLKVAVGNAIIPIAQKILPVINSIVSALVRMANTFSAVITSIFGGTRKEIQAAGAAAAGANSAIGSSAGAAANGEGELADATKKAGKAANGASSSIDELNVIQQDTGSGAETAAGGGSTGSAGGIEVVGQEKVEDQLSPQIQKIVDKVQQLLEPLRNINFEPLAAAFGRLKEAVEPLGKTLFAGLEWAYYNLFVPLAAWTIQDLLPAFLDLLAAACDVLSAAVEALKPLAKWLWDKFLKPIAAWTGGKIVDTLHVLTDALTGVSGWISENQGLVQAMTITAAAFMAVWKGTEIGAWIINAGGLAGIIGKVTKAIKDGTIAKIADKAEDMQIIALYIGDFVKALASTITSIVSRTAAWIGETAAKVASTAAEWAHVAATTAWNAVAAIAEAVTWAFGAAVAFLTSPIGLVILAIGALIAIVVLLVKNWDTVKATALAVWDGIKAVWGKVCGWFTTMVIDPLTKAWDTFKTGFLELWDGIVNGIKGAINGIIGFINGMINAVVDGINWIIDAVNTLSWDIPDWPIFGDLAGQTFGFNITPITAPQIPLLAQGAVLPANKPFLAMVGDQSRGTNVEAPLETIKQAVAEVVAKMGGAQEFTAQQPIEVSLDGEVIYRALARIAASRGVGIGGAFANAY